MDSEETRISDVSQENTEKAVEPPTTKSAEEVIGTNTTSATPTNVTVTVNETPTLVETTNSTELAVHQGDTVNMESLDPQKTMLLGVYKSLISQARSIGAQIGLEPIMLDKAIMPVNMEPQQVITTISQLDGLIDTLMKGFGIPDIDDPEGTESAQYSIEAQVTKALCEFFKIAAGSEFSDKNRRQLKTIHATLVAMLPDVCETANTEESKGIEEPAILKVYTDASRSTW
jgi:hypothetical protein